MDAVSVLINKQENTSEGAKTLADLVALHTKIQGIKLKTAERKIERLHDDLETIKKKNPKDYDRMITELKQLLDHNS
jgi:polyhydroxyalkanoate synthesis regulator phasin